MESYHADSESPTIRGTQSSQRVRVEAVVPVVDECVVVDVEEVDDVNVVEEEKLDVSVTPVVLLVNEVLLLVVFVSVICVEV